MTSELNYLLAFTAGILGSGHCVGMCGALVSSFFMKVKRGDIRLYAAYHGARISVYMLLGVLAALIQGVLQIFVGLVVILLALDMLKLLPWRLSFSILPKHLLRHGLSMATTRGAVTGLPAYAVHRSNSHHSGRSHGWRAVNAGIWCRHTAVHALC